MVRNPTLVIVAFVALSCILIGAPAEEPDSSHPLSIMSHGSPTMRFEPNLGQTEAEVDFLSRGSGYKLFLTSSEAVFSLAKTVATNDRTVLRMKIKGANPEVRPDGLEMLAGKSHYYYGSDSEKWVTNIPGFARVIYREVYPGIDLVYRGNQRQLEYDFIVAPGTNPELIRLAFEGVGKIEIDDGGSLLLSVNDGIVVQKPPTVYQEIDGRQEPVSSRYVFKDKLEVGIEVNSYDATRPLVIDPVVVYTYFIGGDLDDNVAGIGVDATGHVYIAGTTSSTDYPTTGSFGASDTSVFVTKLNPDGTDFVWSVLLGGGYAKDLHVDYQNGDVYIAGSTNSPDFPTTAGAYQIQYSGTGPGDGFMAYLGPSGNILHYATYLGGSASDSATAVALGPGGDIYVTGTTSSSDFFDPQLIAGAYDTDHNGGRDVFLAKLNPAGAGSADLLYGTYLGGGSDDGFLGGESELYVDSEGNAYMTGNTKLHIDYPPTFPTTPDAFLPTIRVKKNSSGFTPFIAKMNPAKNGSADLVYSTFLFKDLSQHAGTAIVADEYDRIYATGRVGGSHLPTTSGCFDSTFNRDPSLSLMPWDAYIVVLDTTVPGEAGLQYSTYFGGNSSEYPYEIAVYGASGDLPGNVVISGFIDLHMSYDDSYPTTADAFKTYAEGYQRSTYAYAFESFLATLSPLGHETDDLIFSTIIGGFSNDWIYCAAMEPGGDTVYLGGMTESTAFIPLPDGFPGYTIKGGNDAFALKIEFGGAPPLPPDPPSDLIATAVSSSQINLAWVDNSQGEQGFRIERSEEGGPWVEIDTTGPDVTFYPDTGLTPDTTYAYRVLAFNGAGESDYSNEASDTTFPAGGGAFHSLGETSVAGTVSGTYVDTHSADDVYESITEKESGGKPSKRYSYLEHKWVFNITAGSTVTFHVQAYQDASVDGDHFVFAWSSDDSDYTNMVTVTKTEDDDNYQSFSLPGSLNGTVYIRVKDTDRNQGNRSMDTIYIDHMFIETQ